MVLVLWVFNWSFCIVKYFHNVVTALLILQDKVSRHQDSDKTAYKVR